MTINIRYEIYGNSIFNFGNCRRFLLKNIIIYAAASFGATIRPHSEDFTFDNFCIRVPDGSTRLKAGNAQKMILNMLSTGAMVRSGHVYENMMINLKPTNIKLRGRVIRIVRDITELSEEEAVELLEQGNWVIRDALNICRLLGMAPEILEMVEKNYTD